MRRLPTSHAGNGDETGGKHSIAHADGLEQCLDFSKCQPVHAVDFPVASLIATILGGLRKLGLCPEPSSNVVVSKCLGSYWPGLSHAR